MDRLAELILEQIEAVLERDPSEDALFDLLRIASPKISKESLTDEKLYKKLILQIDVNKKSPLYERADKVVKTLDTFYKDCLKESSSSKTARSRSFLPNDPQALNKKGKYDVATTKKTFPLQFSVFEHVKLHEPDEDLDHKHLEAEVAFQCINARGAIVHGREPSITYKAEGDDREKTVKDIFNKNGGYRALTSIESIKEELMDRGPVVSTSFKLTSAFLSSDTSREEVFETYFENDEHPVLIVGWKNTVVGEVWRICSIVENKDGPVILESAISDDNNVHHVAFRHWGIDDECVVPKQTFEAWAWQEGPYFDIDINEDYSEWCKNSQTMNFKVSSEELCALSTTIGGDLIKASNSRKKFTLRNARKLAQSRSCVLKKVEFHAGEEWKVSVEFPDSMGSVLHLLIHGSTTVRRKRPQLPAKRTSKGGRSG